jgi:hypothetical protein
LAPFLATSILLAAAMPVQAQPKLLEPANLGPKVNTKADETDPFLLPDGKRLFYASNDGGTFKLMVAARKTIPEPFTEAGLVPGVNAKGFDTRSPFYYLSLKEFYFCSNRVPDDAFKDEKNFDIYCKSGDAAPFALQITNTPVDELFPWVTANGNEMFFSRKLKDGWRVCVTNGPKVGAPDKGKIVEEIPVDFHHTTLTPDGLTMYLQGPLGKDRIGLFRTTRTKVGAPWEKPLPLVNLNHPDGKQGDLAPALSLSGMTLFFASDRPGGQGGLDLYWVTAADLKTE